jgi:GT2 family glycosyltransferase
VKERTPLVLSIDVEPDERLIDPAARPRWAGFEAMLPEMRRFRRQLAEATGAPVRFCWLVRVDHQIERAYGRADWGLQQYQRELAELRAEGDTIGAHAHSWRWDEREGTWVADHGDSAWVAHCVRQALTTFRQATGEPARVFSHGDEFLSNDLVGLLEQLGVRRDLTIAPGNQPRPGMVASEQATGSLPDYRGLPRVPYQPSLSDYRKPGIRRRRRLWLLPHTTGLAANPYAPAATAGVASHPLLIGAPLVVNRQLFDAYWQRFPLSVICAIARSDVFLNPFNADQFRQFIGYVADHPRREQLILTSPEQAIRIHQRRLTAQGWDRHAVARYVMSTCFQEQPVETPAPPAHADTKSPSSSSLDHLLPAEPRQRRAADRATIRALENEVQNLRERLHALEQSRWWRLRRRLLRLRSLLRMKLIQGRHGGLLRRLLRALFLPGQKNVRWLAKTLCKHGYLWLEDQPIVILSAPAAVGTYARWLGLHAPRPADLQVYREHLEALRYRPRVSVLLPVFDPPLDWFREAVQSVIDQVYPNWELCIADDASTDPRIRQAIADFAARDARIRFVLRPGNGHISAASNSALALATGEYTALLDHDDVLAPDALYHNVLALNRQSDLDVLYSDEDKIDNCGLRCEPHFKPQWSPDTLLAGNYLTHLLVARTALVREVGGFREGFEGAQDFDLVLRLTERSQRIHHIPRVLYHWRKHARSTSENTAAKSYAYRAGVCALEEAIQRRQEPGTVEQAPGAAGFYMVRYALRRASQTSIVIPTRDQAGVLEACLRSLFERTCLQDFTVLVVDNGSREPRTFELFRKYSEQYPERFSVLRDEGAFNFSRLANGGARATHGSYLLLLNNDVEVAAPDWLTAMLEQAQRPSIGCVGARLLYPDGTVQHAGVVLGRGQPPMHVFRHVDLEAPEYVSRLQLVTNYSAVTGACLLVRRKVFEEVGGFDEGLAIDYNDIDFCLRVRERGYYNVVVPQATLWHHELVSRGSSQASAESRRRLAVERAHFESRWPQYLAGDPHLSPHLAPRNGGLKLVA